MSEIDEKESASTADEENMNSTTSRRSPIVNQSLEKPSQIGSGDAKNLDKEGNLVSTELQEEDINKNTEKSPLEVNTVTINEKSLANESVIEISTTSTSQDVEIDLDTKIQLLESTRSDVSIKEESSDKIEVTEDDDQKQIDDDKKLSVDDQNDTFDDEIELKWDDDESEQGLSEEALKLLDQELGIDDIISTSESESKTDHIVLDDQLRTIEGLTSKNEKNQIESQELPEGCVTIENDPIREISTLNQDPSVSVEEMNVEKEHLTDNSDIDIKIGSVEEMSKAENIFADNTSNTEKDYKLTALMVEEVSDSNKDTEISNILIEVQTECQTKTSDTRNDIVENQYTEKIESTQILDIEEINDPTEKQGIPILDTEDDIQNPELNTNENISEEIKEIIETNEAQPDNTEMPKESKGMKTDLGLNKPDVMLEIPTQELIDIDEYDDTCDDKEMHSIEKEAESVVNIKLADSLSKITEDNVDRELSVTDIVKEKEISKADEVNEMLIVKTTDISEKSSHMDIKTADMNTKLIDSKCEDKPFLSELPSTSKEVMESKSHVIEVKSLDSDIKTDDAESKSLDSNLESQDHDGKSTETNLKLDEQPSTSKSDDMIEEPEPTDSLLAESSRIMDDDDDHDEERDDDSDDFDQDDESSNHMTAEHSEESNPPASESEAIEKDDESEKETAVPDSEVERDNEEPMEIVDDIVCEENDIAEANVDTTMLNEDSIDIKSPSQIDEANDIAEANVDTTMLNEDSIDIKSPSQIDEAAEPESQNKERDGTTPEKDTESRLKALLLTDTKDSNKELSNKSTRQAKATKAANILSFVHLEDSDEDSNKELSNKSSRLALTKATKAAHILSFVHLEDSDEEVQEANKDKSELKTDDSVEITKDETSTLEKALVKPKPVFKMTKLNTSEVSIKTKMSTKPPLIIPEITTTSVLDKENAKKQTDTQANEIFTLDSDSEEEKEQKKEEIKPELPTENPRLNTKCMNPVCTSDATVQHYVADASATRYYGPTKKRAVCETCRDFVNIRNQTLIENIKNLTPLLDLDMDKPTNSLVEISDSESEDETDLYKESEVIGEHEAAILNEKLVDMINDAWLKFNMDDRLKDSEDFINKELKKLEDEGAEVNKLLDDCQLETDRIRKELYNTFHKPAKQLPALAVFDTPVSQYTCLEKDAPVEKGPGLLKTLPEESAAKKVTRSTDSGVEKKEDAKSDKQDDDRDVSVVYLSAEAAPSDLPPAGEIVRPPLRPGLSVHAMRNAFGSWLRGKILDILPKTPTQQYTHCRVKFDHNVKNPCKVLPARCIAYQDPCNVRMTIGTRVLALFRNTTRKESFYSGVVAEIPNPVNNYRYLVFFDDGYAQYVKHQDTRLVCESKSCVWEEVHPFIRDFVRDYLLKYPERPMVRLHPGQRLNTEWNGKWWSAKVLQVDASLAHVHFEEDDRTEWIYRGSTRLAPLYLELQAAERHRTRLPRSKAQFRSNMPYVEYMRSEEQTKAQQQDEMLRRQRAVAKKSTTPSQAQPAPVEDKPDSVTSRVVYYTPKNAVKPKKMVTHTCGPQCKRSDVLTLKELRTYNPLAKPLLSGWERMQVRYRGSKAIMYRAPCGRRLRNIKEVHKYLRLTDSELPVDLFDFNVNTHCLAEFVLHKYNVMKKDLSHGKENVPVPCVNYYDDSLPEFCSYNTERTPTAGVPLNLDPDFLCGCDCEDDCEDKTKCACWKMTLEGARTIGLESSDVGYVFRRLPEPLPSGIYECNARCKCKSTCLNRVAQQPLQLKLQVFKTLRRGWGIRALNDVPKGSFLCVYAGNLLTDATANLDGLNEGDEYLAELDYIEVVEQMKEGYEDDIPETDKKLDKKESKTKMESEEEGATESDEEQNDSDKMDDDFQPGFIGMGLTDFDKRLRKRNKKKQEEDKEKEKEADGQKTDGCITISDDEEVREPSRFTAQAGMGDKGFISRYKSVRTLFGEDEACYIMDAKVQGNIGRYLNHSCQPNVFVQNVFVDTHDPRFPWVAFFALAHIRAGTELTWNYNYDIGSVPGKVLYCYCGATNCRGRLL